MAGFVRSLRATWRSFLLQFAATFAILALVWWALAPVYASLLAAMARPLIPLVETTSGTRYLVEGATIVAARRIPVPEHQQVVTLRRPLWVASGDYNVALLAALVLATPGWSWRQRGRALGLSLALLALTQIAFFVVNAEYTQLWPIPTKWGLLRPPGYSPAKLVLFDWLYAFFDFMGRGFFALLLYWGLIAMTWGRSSKPESVGGIARNDPCPCGSGAKYKRCCGA